MAGLIDFDAITAANERLVAAIAEGFTSDEYTEKVLGIDPAALHNAAEEVADEPFVRDAAAPAGLKDGTLRRAGLSRHQRDLVKKEIADTYFVAFQAAAQIAKDRSS